jgi:cytochrome c oxidase subunit IV
MENVLAHHRRTYVKIYFALLALLAATVGAVYIHLGPFNIVLALAIAIVKAILVILFFMHVKEAPRLVWIYAFLGFFFTCHLLIGTVGDVVTRR